MIRISDLFPSMTPEEEDCDESEDEETADDPPYQCTDRDAGSKKLPLVRFCCFHVLTKSRSEDETHFFPTSALSVEAD